MRNYYVQSDLQQATTAAHLCADLHPSSWQVPHGVVTAMVAELELEGGAAQSLANQLVAHADAEGRNLPQNVLDVLHGIGHSRGVARAVAGGRREGGGGGGEM